MQHGILHLLSRIKNNYDDRDTYIEAQARSTRPRRVFFCPVAVVAPVLFDDDPGKHRRTGLDALSYICCMEKASDIGKPTVPIDLIGPDHWPVSRRHRGRTTKVIAFIVGGLAAAGLIAYKMLGATH